jgi:Xaa-Pro aminopeptidase
MAAMRVAVPGAWEYELEAAAEGTFRRLGAERVGYPSIVGTGHNSTVLHYDESRAQLQAGDVIVMDMAAEFGYYTADVTRTIPASGRFTPRQRAIYDLVLGAQQAALDSVRPGVTMAQLTQIARRHMRERSGDLCGARTCDAFFIHGLGHWIGMDVHDVGGYGRPMVPGMVFTIEPGIYLPEEKLGVRIEDDVLVTATGFELLSRGVPRQAAEVEALMAAARKR